VSERRAILAVHFYNTLDRVTDS